MANPLPAQNDNRFINQVCSNTKTDFIEITEDKLENILIKFLDGFKKANNWLAPLSILITILIAILTANFDKNFLTINSNIWTAIFYLSLFASLIWLTCSLFNAVKYRNKSNIDCLIKTIKNN
jgi:hypothetical protein